MNEKIERKSSERRKEGGILNNNKTRKPRTVKERQADSNIP